MIKKILHCVSTKCFKIELMSVMSYGTLIQTPEKINYAEKLIL